VSGRVQGVWYRGSAQEKACELNLRGYAKNLSDGRVEVIACGRSEAVEAMVAWLAEGPPMARVSTIERHAASPESCRGFHGFVTR
jgi:acylphosphatase